MENTLFTRTSCIILSAGNSERMGMPKALLKFDTETTFLQKIIGVFLEAGVNQIIVVVNSGLFAQLKDSEGNLSGNYDMVLNDNIALGRFYSLQKGVQKLKPGNSCFFQNVDNPFTTPELLAGLISHRHEADVIIPSFQNRAGHPVLFSPLVASDILRSHETGVRLDQFFTRFRVKHIETDDGRMLLNINSPAEYLAAGFKP